MMRSTTTSGEEEPSHPPTESFFEDPLRLQTLLVAVDFSDASFRALEYALPLARRFAASVHVIYVYEGKAPFTSLLEKPELFSDPASELFSPDEISRRLRDEVQRRFSVGVGAKNCHYRTGRAAAEICAGAHDLHADLIVIATHGHTGVKHLTLGSTAEKVVHHAPCPVLVVRGATRGALKTAAEGIVLEKILVPVDFSDCAKEGARYASVFATKVGADLLLMHVMQPPGGISLADSSPLMQKALLEAEDKLDEMVNLLPLVNVSAETEVVLGGPLEKLEEASARPEIDMVIASTHGYTGLRHALLGSVADQLIRLAKCPVLVVPSHSRAAH